MKVLKVKTQNSRKQDLVGDGVEGIALIKLKSYIRDLAPEDIQKLYKNHNLQEIYGYLVLFPQYEYPIFKMNFSLEELEYEEVDISEDIQMYINQFINNGEGLWTYL